MRNEYGRKTHGLYSIVANFNQAYYATYCDVFVFRGDAMNKLKGMTVNERLFTFNKFEAFDEAIKSKSTHQAVNILIQCELAREEALKIVKTIFQTPDKYGY